MTVFENFCRAPDRFFSLESSLGVYEMRSEESVDEGRLSESSLT